MSKWLHLKGDADRGEGDFYDIIRHIYKLVYLGLT